MRLFGGTDLVLYFFFYAFAAWVLETLFFSLKKQRFVNCGILDLPLLLTHGAAMANLILVSSGEMPERSRFLFGLVQTLALFFYFSAACTRAAHHCRGVDVRFT